MRKSDMRNRLDGMIKKGYELQKQWQYLIEDMEELRAEMHNRPRKMQGKATSVTCTPEVKQRILSLHKSFPDLPQHEIARMLNVIPARVSETIAGKRT